MKRSFFIQISVLLLAVTTLTTPVWAQVLTSRIDGTVTDQTGGVLPGAEVNLLNINTNAAKTTLTNDSGLYVFPQVQQGYYNISVIMPGFNKAVIENIQVEVGKPTTVDVELGVGVVTEEVVVTASKGQSVLNTVNAEINVMVNRAQIEELPLNGRSPTELALLQAGVTGGGEIARSASVNGMRGTFNNLTLDGINNQDNYIREDGFFGVIPLRESFVEEFNITTSNSDMASGMGASQTQMVTRSGTNEYHGQVYYYHQNDALNANEFFNNAAGLEKPRLLNHQYGAAVGGPVFKDKVFFFANFEKEKSPQSLSTARTVLSGPARNGSFSYYGSDSGQLETVNLFDIGGISADPAMSSLVGLTPLPNDPGSTLGDGMNTLGFRYNNDGTSDQDWIVLRVDYQINQDHALSGTFHQFRYELGNDAFNDLGTVFPGLSGVGQKSTRRLGSYSLRSNFGPRITNEARFGFQWAPVDFFSNQEYPLGYQLHWGSDWTDLEFVDNPIQNTLPQGRNAPVLEFADNANWVTGNHTFTFGADYRWSQVDQYNDGGILPLYTLGFGAATPNPLDQAAFPGGISNNDFDNASQLLSILGGVLNSGTQVFNVTSPTSGFVDGATQSEILKQNFFSVYGGDTWRLTPSVTVNYGLRWEYHGVPYEKNGLALLPRGGVEAVLDPEAIIDFAGPNGARHFFKEDYNNFAPNIGVAWRFLDKGVFRAGYSLNYVIDNNMTVVSNALSGNDGLSQRVSVFGIDGTVSGANLGGLPQPEFKVPRTARDQILSDPQAALFTIDPNLRVPYVQQWNVGVQYEILPDTALEVRYVGNHGIKLGRAIDLNQVMYPQEFIDDFRRAQANIAANGDPMVGEPLTMLTSLGLGGYLFDPTIQNWIANGEIGSYVGGFLAPYRSYFFAGEGGEDFGSSIPISLFYRNPNIFVGDVVTNNAWSKYNALQIELRRRFRNGFTGQFNYSFGKVTTNFSGTQTGFRGLFDNNQPNIEIMRPDYDITHTLNGNFVWQLPLGAGRAYLNQSGPVDWFLGGWNASGIIRIRSGETVNIISGRGTINRGGSRGQTNSATLSGMTISDLQDKTGAFRDDQGRIVLFDPSLIGQDGRASSSYFLNPGLLEAGTLGLSPVSGPWYASFDLGLRKSFKLPLTEESKVELRVDAFNLFNRANFNIRTTPGSGQVLDSLGVTNRHSINASDFGVISDTFSARTMQVGLKVSF